MVSSYRLWIIAHRGASAVAPESTRAAIAAALAAGADMVELDVHMTRDGRLVIIHDTELRDTTNGTGRVTARTYAQLSRLDAGAWFHPRFAGQRLLLVSQAIRLIQPPCRLNLELKRTKRSRQLIHQLLRIIRRCGIRRRLLVSSFDAGLLNLLRSQHLSRALICAQAPDRSLRQAIRLECEAWHPLARFVTPRRLATAHAAGLRVHAWTVEDRPTAHRLRRWGIDGLFTNHPARLRRLLA